MEDQINLTPADRNYTWENNHDLITRAMLRLARKNKRLATTAEIATETGLSRVTVHKHLKELCAGKLMQQDVEEFKLLAKPLLGNITFMFMDGDIRANRLATQIMGIDIRGNKKTDNGETQAPNDK